MPTSSRRVTALTPAAPPKQASAVKRTCARISVAAAGALVCSLAFAGVAAANHDPNSPGNWSPACGTQVTPPAGTTLTLSADVGPCGPTAAGAGLRVEGAQGTAVAKVTIDLNGHSVYGCDNPLAACNTGGTPPGAAYVTGEGAGFLVNGSTYVEVKNGTVRDFDSGIVIHGGSANRVSGVTVAKNIGTALTSSSYGEGIGIYLSNNNTIVGNTVDENGPFAGIGVYQFSPDNTGLTTVNTTADGNKIGDGTGATSRGTCPAGGGNTVTKSNVTPNGTTYQDDGIRLEPKVNNNTVDCNSVSGSSLEGIAVFADALDNKVRYNSVTGNGAHGLLTQRKGDGIRVFLRAARTIVTGNKVCANAGSGISVDSTTTYPTPLEKSTIQDNVSGAGAECPSNGAGRDLPNRAPAYDLLEGGHALVSEACRHTWSGNLGGSAFPACTAAP